MICCALRVNTSVKFWVDTIAIVEGNEKLRNCSVLGVSCGVTGIGSIFVSVVRSFIVTVAISRVVSGTVSSVVFGVVFSGEGAIVIILIQKLNCLAQGMGLCKESWRTAPKPPILGAMIRWLKVWLKV